jgi:hypothetical protein
MTSYKSLAIEPLAKLMGTDLYTAYCANQFLNIPYVDSNQEIDQYLYSFARDSIVRFCLFCFFLLRNAFFKHKYRYLCYFIFFCVKQMNKPDKK